MEDLGTYIKIGMNINNDFKIPAFKTISSDNKVIIKLLNLTEFISNSYFSKRVMKLGHMKQQNSRLSNIK